MIYDGHIHVAIRLADELENSRSSSLGIDQLIQRMDDLAIDKAVIMIDPSTTKLFCKKDANHRLKTIDIEQNNLKIICTSCNNIVYRGPDPLRPFNEKLLSESQKYPNRLLPFVFLSISDSTVAEEIKYFEGKYSEQFFGYKLHPSFSGRAITTIKNFPSTKTLLVHTGVDTITHPKNVIKFSRQYTGNIILAHFAKLDYESLQEISKNKKLFVDSSPATRILFLKKEQASRVFRHPYFENISTESELYHHIIGLSMANKLIYGSDSPYGDLKKELQIANDLKLSPEIYTKIMYSNLMNALKKNELHTNLGINPHHR